MADIVGYFPATAAVDGASGARLRYAEAQVYAWTDTNFITPLAITDLQGIPMADGKLIASDGVYPDFMPPAGILQVRARSGSYVTPMTSIAVYAQSAKDSADRADQAALQISQDVDEVTTIAVEVKAVGMTTDAQIEGRIKDPASKTAVALKSTFVAVRTSDNEALPAGTIVVITLDKTLAQITASPVADIADITFRTGA